MNRKSIYPLTQTSNELDQKGLLLRVVSGVAEILLTTDEEEFKSSLWEAMALLARCVQVDRIYIWQNIIQDGCLHYVQQSEWLSDSPQEGKIIRPKESFSYAESIPEWEKKFLEKQCVNGPLSSLSQTEQERLGPYGIKSILVTPVYFQNHFWGFVSFDDCQKERTFTEDEVGILRSANLMLASAMHRHETAARIREADEYARLMLDATPLCCSMWDRNLNLIDCNKEAVNFYGLKDKQEYLDRFFELSPEYQPDGSLSKKKAREYIGAAFQQGGRIVFEWMQQMPDGTPMPAEVTCVRVRRGDEFIVAGYTRDLREHKKMMESIEDKDTLLKTVNEVAGILLHSDTSAFETELHRCLAMMGEAVGADRIYICKNFEKDGQLYTSQLYEWSGGAEPQQEFLQDISYREKVPGWEKKLSNGQCINAVVRDLSPEEQAQLSPQGILSILVVPIFLHDQLWGFAGFGDCHSERVFSGEIESILCSAGLLIANALLRNEMTHDIQTAVEQAQGANNAKSVFLARMSHEIRTPMNVIAGMTELMLHEEMPASIYEYVQNIKHASANMLSLISDILDFSKIEAGTLNILMVEYSLTSLINDVLNIIRMRVSEKPIFFTVNIDCNVPSLLIGDETRIRQMLLNVLDNAVKYTAEGFISLELTGEIKEDIVVLSAEVSDSGMGIREDDLAMLFDDFVRLEGERNKGVQGTGLGLSITKSLCQALGGNISVRSEYGVGSTFTITVPQAIKSHDEKFAHVSDAETRRVLLYEARSVYADSIVRSFDNLGVCCTLVETQKEFCEEIKNQYYPFIFASSQMSESVGKIVKESKLDSVLVLIMEFGEVPVMPNVRTIAMPVHSASIATILNGTEDNVYYHKNRQDNTRFIAPSADILVVDDLITNLKVAQGLMRPYQMRIDICESGEEAVELIQKKQYDIIFMDHMMPGMNGIETTGLIRSLEDGSGYYGSIPIIALTANAVSGVKEMFLQNGMNDFLAKPIDIGKLHGILEKWIDENKKLRDEKITSLPPDINPVQLQIEGVDVQAAITMMGGNIDGYIQTLASFHADGADKIIKIRDCVEKNDIRLYTIYVHAVKNASASIGAWKISDFFKTLEMAGTRGDSKFILEHTEYVLDKLEMLLKNIYTVVSKNQDEPITENDPEFLRSEILKLKNALDYRDAGEVYDIMKTLGRIKWDQQGSHILEEISRNILFINYTDATAVVDKLLIHATDKDDLHISRT